MALLSGILYCGIATEKAEALAEPLALDDKAALRELHIEVARKGLDAVDPAGRSMRELVLELADYAGGRLGDADCTWANPEDLAAVREHVAG